jgi:surfeit locus 1 family protein
VNAKFKFWLVTFATVLGIGVTASMGRWQLSRAAQKLELQAAMDAQGGKTPLSTAALRSVTDWTPLLHHRARLRGTWVPTGTVFLDNRQMNARVGFFVLTPFVLEGGAGALVVQRGWVPRNFEDRARLPVVTTPTGVVEIEGRIAPAPSQLYEPGATANGAIRQNLDLAQFRAETVLPLAPMTLQQTGAPSDGLLREWPTVNLGVDKHYGYAFQWFGLAALIAGLYLWFQMVRPFLNRRHKATTHA